MHQSRNIYIPWQKDSNNEKRKKNGIYKGKKRKTYNHTVRAFNIYFRVSNTTSRQKSSTSDQYNQPDWLMWYLQALHIMRGAEINEVKDSYENFISQSCFFWNKSITWL